MENNKVIEGTSCKILRTVINATNNVTKDNNLILFQDTNRPYITFVLPEQVFTPKVNFGIKLLEKMPDFELKINGTYRHFKGNIYKINSIAYNPLEKEYYVIYTALYGEYKEYGRRITEFASIIDANKKDNITKQHVRFKLISE